MADAKATAVTVRAYEIASKVNASRKEQGLASSLTAVISEAVVKQFGDNTQDEATGNS